MILRKIKYGLFLVFLLLLLATLELSLIGLPDNLARRIEKRLQLSGLVVTLEKVKLGVFEGLVATKVRCYRKGDIGAPLLEAEKIILRFRPLAWLRGRIGLSGALIKNGVAALPLPSASSNAAAPQPERFLLEVHWARVGWDEASALSGAPGATRLRLEECAAQLPGLRLTGRGELILPREDKAAALPAVESAAATAAQPEALFLERLVAAWERCRRNMNKSDAINVDVTFFLDSADRNSLVVELQADARQTRFSGAALGAWDLKLNLEGAAGEGVWQLNDAEIEGVGLSSGSGRFRFDQTNLVLKTLEVNVGKETSRGPLKLSGEIDLPTRQYRGALATAFDFNGLHPLLVKLNNNLAAAVTWFQFPDQPPVAKADFHGRWGTNAFFYLTGQAQGDNFPYHGVTNLLMKLGFAVDLSPSNASLVLAPLLVVREEGTVQGQARLDFQEELIRFDGLSTADPQAVAGMLDEFIAEIVSQFRFKGPAKVAAWGTAGYSSMARNDLDIEIDAQRAGWKALLMDRSTLSLRLVADTAYINDVQADFCRGRIEGQGLVYPVVNSSNLRYQAQADISDVDFKLLVRDLLQLPAEEHSGRLSGALALEGELGPAAAQSAEGRGWVKIDGSRIFQIPLFGGLSEFLGRIVPGINLFMRLTDAKAGFVIADGKLHSDDIVIAGEVITITGKGDYHLNGELDFAVQVNLFKEGSLLGGLVHTAMAPVAKMLEFRLTGTVADPRWRPAYLPKEMFLIFD